MINPFHPILTDFQDFQDTHAKKSICAAIPTGRRVLEVGCKKGDLLASIQPIYGEGIDLSPRWIEQAQQVYPGFTFHCSDAWLAIERISALDFDYLVLSSLPNQKEEFQKLLKLIGSVCSPGLRVVFNFDPGRIFHSQEFEEILASAAFELIQESGNVPFSRIRLPLIARSTRALEVDPKRISISVIIPARDEVGNIPGLIDRIPEIGAGTEIIFVEGNSSDQTFETLQEEIKRHPNRKCILLRQPGKGKWDAVRAGLDRASGQIITILDSDLTVQPEELPRFTDLLLTNQGEFINGVRVLKPYNPRIMNPIKFIGNRIICFVLSWIISQRLEDTLCGVKTFWRKDYERFAPNLDPILKEDPFGDFQLLFGAARENLKIINLSVPYYGRDYGRSKTLLLSHGWLLVRILFEQIIVRKFMVTKAEGIQKFTR
jgi:SAM-dependent methyltransferase